MPKRLSDEQFEVLQANGAMPTEYEVAAHEPGAIFRALGSTGLPDIEQVDQMGTNDDTVTPTSETTNNTDFEAQLAKAFDDTSRLLTLLGVPKLQIVSAPEQYPDVKARYELFQQLDMEPAIVLTPARRSLAFWHELVKKVQHSPLNPVDSRGGQRVLRGQGLEISDAVADRWSILVAGSHKYSIDVINASDWPKAHFVTKYGYVSGPSALPHTVLNEILRMLDYAEIPDRSTEHLRSITPLVEVPCLPKPDTYLTLQLTRIINGMEPVDVMTASWLKGRLPQGRLLRGDWSPEEGTLHICSLDTDAGIDAGGVRPASNVYLIRA